MIWRSPEPRYDVASAIAQGGRAYQEDALVTDFPFGMDSGVAVLADGMGGHAAGDVASKIVVTEVYAALKFRSAEFASDETAIPGHMTRAASRANRMVRDHVGANPSTKGMGATLVSLVMVENRLYWMSIGDSPLYVLRGGKLSQLNEDHSLAPQIDYMAEQGLITAEAAKAHPDRNCLTSVILGGKVARSDCPGAPFELQLGDIVVVSSDGLQYLDTPVIQKLLHKHRRRKSAEIAGYLLEALEKLADPDQDNISFSVIKLNHMKPVEQKIVPKPVDYVEADRLPSTRLAVLPNPGSPEAAEEIADGLEIPMPEPVAAAEPAVEAASDGKIPGPGEKLEEYHYRGQTFTKVVKDPTYVPPTPEAEAPEGAAETAPEAAQDDSDTGEEATEAETPETADGPTAEAPEEDASETAEAADDTSEADEAETEAEAAPDDTPEETDEGPEEDPEEASVEELDATLAFRPAKRAAGQAG